MRSCALSGRPGFCSNFVWQGKEVGGRVEAALKNGFPGGLDSAQSPSAVFSVMDRQTTIKTLIGLGLAPLVIVFVLWVCSGFGQRPSRVEAANQKQILLLSNGTEPEDLDPHVVTGVPEHHIISSLLEGLTAEDPVDLHPVPGAAESWDVSDDGLIYTFHLRKDGRWSNGDPLTAEDFIESFKRILTPTLGSKYAYMLYVMEGAEAFQSGDLTDFSKVGAKAIDPLTLEIRLNAPTPYFLSLLTHYTWYPVHMPSIRKSGDPYRPGNRWTRPESYVGNGPFKLAEWRMNTFVRVVRNPRYWNAKIVKLDEIHFFGIESEDTDERGFRAGQTHNVYQLPQSKIDSYRERYPELLHIDPYAGSYFYRVNVTRPPFDNKLVRQALAMAIDRESLVKNVTRGGQLGANYLTPPRIGGYTARARIPSDPERARRLLAEAGYPDGKGFPNAEILYNTNEGHRAIAEAIQEMWKQELNINVTLVNQEWKVYLDNQRRLNYGVSRTGWIGDYVDPNTFLDMWTSWSQQNQTGWKNAEYDGLIRKAAESRDMEKRLEYFQRAEEILMEEVPVIPIYIYTRVYALSPNVRGWHPTILDHHPFQYLYLDPDKEVAGP